jgi:hypothetical protein
MPHGKRGHEQICLLLPVGQKLRKQGEEPVYRLGEIHRTGFKAREDSGFNRIPEFSRQKLLLALLIIYMGLDYFEREKFFLRVYLRFA